MTNSEISDDRKHSCVVSDDVEVCRINRFLLFDVREWRTQEERTASAHRQDCEQQTSSFQLESRRQGTDYIYQSFYPSSSTRRHVFQTNDHDPRNLSNTSSCFCPSHRDSGTFHYENDNGTLLEGQCLCQNRYLGALFTLINDNIKICAKRSGKVLIDSHPNALLGKAELWECSAEHWHMASWQCHSPAFTYWLWFPSGQKALRGTRPPDSNIIKVVFGHEGTQCSRMTARNIRPNTQAPLAELHGCVPSWFHYALSQPYHTSVTKLLPVFWCPFNSASPKNFTTALQNKNRMGPACSKVNSSMVEGLSKDSDVVTYL